MHIKRNQQLVKKQGCSVDTSTNQTDVTMEWPVQGLVHTTSNSQLGLETGGKSKPTDPREWGQQAASKQRGIAAATSCSQCGIWGQKLGLGFPIKWEIMECITSSCQHGSED